MDEDRKNNLITAVLLLVIAVFFVFIFIEMTKENQNLEIKQSFTKSAFDSQKNVDDLGKLDKQEKLEQKDKNIYVHICGAVQNPGVYKISDGIITADVVNLAGGLLSTADMSAVNLARRVRNGEKIEIPSIFETEKKRNSGDKKVSYKNSSKEGKGDDIEEIDLVSDVININDASRSDIESIPGIGKKTAEKIISYRDEHGVIENLDELENIPGIRKNIISKCRKYLIVD